MPLPGAVVVLVVSDVAPLVAEDVVVTADVKVEKVVVDVEERRQFANGLNSVTLTNYTVPT